MNDDKVIRFPGLAGNKKGKADLGKAAGAAAAEGKAPVGPPLAGDISGLTEDQSKAIQVILSGMAFVFVGIKPSERGADFYTALHGEAADLRNAQAHLPSVIDRAYGRRGI